MRTPYYNTVTGEVRTYEMASHVGRRAAYRYRENPDVVEYDFRLLDEGYEQHLYFPTKMAKKRLYQKNSNIEQYRIINHPNRGGSWLDLPTSEVAKKIDDFVQLCLDRGIKRPYLRFMLGKTENDFIFYTDQKKGTHLDGWQTFESATKYVTENY